MARFKKTYDVATGVATFDYEGQGSIIVDINTLDPDIVRQLTMHGLVQKVGDGAALSKDALDADKWNRAREVAERLMAGEWGKEREGTGPRPTATIEALARRQAAVNAGVDVSNVAAIIALEISPEMLERASVAWEGKTEEDRKRIRANGSIKAIVSAVRAARDAGKAGAESDVDLSI